MMVMSVVSTIGAVRLFLDCSGRDVGIFGSHCGVRVKSTRVIQTWLVLSYKPATRFHNMNEIN